MDLEKTVHLYQISGGECICFRKKYDFTGIQSRKLLIFPDFMIYSAYYENKNQETNILDFRRSAVFGDIADHYQSESSISDAVRQ